MLTIVSLALLFAAQSQPSPAALHVVVIEGEDAVNIIQQKTAVNGQAAVSSLSPTVSGASGGGGGAAGGAGGGLSTTTLIVAGAAVAGGAVAATQIADKVSGEASFKGTFSGTINFTDTAVSGEFEYEGPSSVTASTCGNVTPPIPSFIGSTDVSGTPFSFSGQRTIPAPAGGPSTSSKEDRSEEVLSV